MITIHCSNPNCDQEIRYVPGDQIRPWAVEVRLRSNGEPWRFCGLRCATRWILELEGVDSLR